MNPRTASQAVLSEWGTLIIAGAVPGPGDNAGFLWDAPPGGTGQMYGARFDEDGMIAGVRGTAAWLD